MQAMTNLAIKTKSCHSHNGDEFGQILSNSQINANKLNREACHVGGFDDFGECDEFGEISSNCQMDTNKQTHGGQLCWRI